MMFSRPHINRLNSVSRTKVGSNRANQLHRPFYIGNRNFFWKSHRSSNQEQPHFDPFQRNGKSTRWKSSSTHNNSNRTNETNHDSKASFSSFFFDAYAACKGKRCLMGKDGNGIVSSPENCGEDSFFITKYVLGVADGVGGWNENNVDPGEISRSLMRHAKDTVVVMETNQMDDTHGILSKAFQFALDDEKVEAGSTTACILRIRTSPCGTKPILQYSNLGDSGFVIFRKGHLFFRSKFQYYGRAPYQLAKVPPKFKIYGAIENHPNDADSEEIELEVGDIIVLASDGVWDNFKPDLEPSPSYFPPLVMWRYHWHGYIASLQEVLESCPFGKETAFNIVKAAVQHNMKPDDVTVIVAKVVAVPTKEEQVNNNDEKP